MRNGEQKMTDIQKSLMDMQDLGYRDFNSSLLPGVPKESVIGMNKEASIKRFLTSLPERYKVAEGESIFNACIFEINEDNCRTIKIERINLK